MDPDPQAGPDDEVDEHGPYRRDRQLLPAGTQPAEPSYSAAARQESDQLYYGPQDPKHEFPLGSYEQLTTHHERVARNEQTGEFPAADRYVAMPRLPPISNYWPAEAAEYAPRPATAPASPAPAGPETAGPERPVRRSAARRAASWVAVLLLGAAVVAGVQMYRSDSGPATTAGGAPSVPTADPTAEQPAGQAAAEQPTAPAVDEQDGTGPVSVAPSATPGPARDAHTISAPVGGRTSAVFDLISDASSLRLRAADLGGDLYRISTPESGRAVPRITAKGDRLELRLIGADKLDGGPVEVQLNADVRWGLRVSGGVAQSVIDLSGGKLDRVDLTGGATRIDLTLPPPGGTTTVRMTGGVNQFLVHRAAGEPVRIRARKGAGRVVLDGRTDNGVAAGAVFASPGWAAARDRIDLDAVEGMGTLTVDRG